MRFDMRAPAGGASTTELYATALDMAAWAETRGAVMAVISEHHTQSDGYLPSPLVLATALAARTKSLPIMTAAVILPLYDPIRLAEDMVVLDIISGGRVSYVLAVGYRPEEFEHHGVDFKRRGRLVEGQLELVLRAKTGEPFDYEGRRIHVTPAPVTPGGPRVAWGGGSGAAAERAGRHGLDFFGQGSGPDLEALYAEAAREHGYQPGACVLPSTAQATTVFVAHDLDRAWEELGPHLLHDVISYGAMNPGEDEHRQPLDRQLRRRAAGGEPHAPDPHGRGSCRHDPLGRPASAPSTRGRPPPGDRMALPAGRRGGRDDRSRRYRHGRARRVADGVSEPLP